MPSKAGNISGPLPEIATETARLLRLLTAPLLVVGPHGTIVGVNANLREMFGADADYFVGRQLLDLAVGERDKISRTLALFAASGDWLIGALALRRPDGAVIDFPCKGVLVQRPAGDLPALTAIQLDQRLQFHALTRKIDELNAEMRRRLRAEEQLRLSGAALRQAYAYNRGLIETTPDPLVTIDLEGRITDVNAATEAVCGRLRQELIGREFADLFTDPGKARLGHRLVVEQGLVTDYGLDIRHRDGRVTPVLYNASVYRNEAGEVIGVLAAARDISERKRTEAELTRYRDHLETLVEQRTAALTESNRRLAVANDDIKRASNAKTRFLAAASHDLRQPIQALRLHLHLLAQKPLDESAARVVATIGETLNSTEGMLGKLMEFAALECGKVTVSRQRFRVDDLLEKIAGEAAPEAGAKGLRVRTRVFPCSTETDPVLLERIVRNLVWNAIRYTTRGGLLIGLRRRGGEVAVAVHDTGIGIPQAQQATIFEEFEQLGNLERDRDKGMGLGLAIASRTAGLLGHRLALRSRAGKGSTFTIDLPCVCHVRPAADESAEPPPAASAPARILLVEDDTLQARALAAILIDSGFSVSVARDAATAILAAQPHAPDLIVSDYRLPAGISGIEAIRRVRQHLGRIVPAILITGDTQASIAEQARQEACAIVHKPYSPGSLIDVINRRLLSDRQDAAR